MMGGGWRGGRLWVRRKIFVMGFSKVSFEGRWGVVSLGGGLNILLQGRTICENAV
jgi:hypothetical protein